MLRPNSQPYGVKPRWSPHCKTDIIQLAPASAAVPAIGTACKSSPIRQKTVSQRPGQRLINMTTGLALLMVALSPHYWTAIRLRA